MIDLLSILCILSGIVIILLLWKIARIYCAVDEICQQFEKCLSEDTNVGISIHIYDRHIRRIAVLIDRQLKHLRQEHIRYCQGDQELKDAITNISHDLRTPLTAICGYMDLLDREELPETALEYLKIIGNRIQAMKQLTEELFHYSVVVSVRKYNSKELVILNEMLEECVADGYGALKKAGIEPEVEIVEQKIGRQLNRAALVRILENLMGNAVKYSDGDLKIQLTQEGIIRFSNHTFSLDEVAVSRLFDRFYTVETGKNSTGLGLSIAKALAEEIGGQLTAEINQGLFTVELVLSRNN